MLATLLIAVLSLAVWAVLVFGTAVNSGAVHLLLAVGTTLLVRWWALRA
ncbi:MAG: hypothetical protein M3Q37_10725 [Gemmatimonadota bacterium]|nr:hypothetical protein [Gemmatimonadota bacterium]